MPSKESVIFRNVMVIAAAETQKKLEDEGQMQLSNDDSKWMVERAGGVVTKHETGTHFDWTRQQTVFIKHRWADKEAILAARTLERCIEDSERD